MHTDNGNQSAPAGRGAVGASLLLVWLLGAVMAPGSVAAVGAPASLPLQTPKQDCLTWELTRAKVVRPGQSLTNAAGITLTGYTIEATARATNAGPLPEATFHLTLNAFCPRTNYSNLKAGRWQVRGTWVVVDQPPAQDQNAGKADRPHPEYLQGYLLAELDTCPTLPLSRFDAVAWASETRSPSLRKKYEGSLQGEGRFEGRLHLRLSPPISPPTEADPNQPGKHANPISDQFPCH
ncbi:MAG TPA: hypothetical protein VJA21_27205 [Verrucomicrobiae bacterium]